MRTPRPYRPKVLPGRVTPEQVINLSERDDVEEHQQRLRHEQQDVQKRIARLVAAIENGGDAAPLVAKVRELEARQKTLETEVASLRPGPRLAPAVIADRLAEWRRLLRQSPTQGRTVLQRIVHGRLTFTPRTNVITGEVDVVRLMDPTGPERMRAALPDYRGETIIPGSGHWVQQETPAAFNEALLGFLRTL